MTLAVILATLSTACAQNQQGDYEQQAEDPPLHPTQTPQRLKIEQKEEPENYRWEDEVISEEREASMERFKKYQKEQFDNEWRAEYKDMLPGVCPKPGMFKSRVKNFDHKKLAGIWMRVFDEKDNALNYTCQSQLYQYGENDHNSMQSFSAQKFTENHLEWRERIEPGFDDSQEYIGDTNTQLIFNFTDPTVGFYKPLKRQGAYTKTPEMENGGFDPYIWD